MLCLCMIITIQKMIMKWIGIFVICHFLVQIASHEYGIEPDYERPYVLHNRQQITPLLLMVDATNRLGLSILKHHSFGNANNVAFSPCGLGSVLVALYEGSDGHSSFEIYQALDVPFDRDLVRIGFRDIHRRLRSYFYQQENVLSGLSLSKENVTIRSGYESILRFYGYDLGNEDDGNDFVTTTTASKRREQDDQVRTTTVKTEFVTEMPSTSLPDISTKIQVTESPESEPETTEADEVKVQQTTTPKVVATTSNINLNKTPTDMQTEAVTEQRTDTDPTEVYTEAPTAPPTESPSELPTEDAAPTTTPTESLIESRIEPTTQTNPPTTFPKTFSTSLPSTLAVTFPRTFPTITTQFPYPSETTTQTEIYPTTARFTYPPTERTIPPTETTIPPTETTIPPTEKTIPPTEKTIPPTEKTVPPTEKTTPLTEDTTTLPVTEMTSTSRSTMYIFTFKPITTTPIPEPDYTTTRRYYNVPVTIPPPMTTVRTTDFSNARLLNTLPTLPIPIAIRPNTADTPNSRTFNLRNSRIYRIKREPTNYNNFIPLTSSGYGVSSNVDFYDTYFNYATPNPPDVYYPDGNPIFATKEFEQIDHHHDEIDHIFYLSTHDSIRIGFKVYNTILRFAYIRRIQASALELPLDSDNYSLLIIVPDQPIEELVHAMSSPLSPSLREIRATLRNNWIKTMIPEFHLKGNVVLTGDLMKLGIHDIFEPNKADFSPMTDEFGIYARHIEQSITINIRTHANNQLRRYAQQFFDPIKVPVNRPFVFAIIDNELDLAIMVGRVLNPINSRIF